jgi:hypothetical protein
VARTLAVAAAAALISAADGVSNSHRGNWIWKWSFASMRSRLCKGWRREWKVMGYRTFAYSNSIKRRELVPTQQVPGAPHASKALKAIANLKSYGG